MKTFAIVLTLCIVGAYASTLKDDQKAKLREYKESCITETSADKAVIDSIIKGGPINRDEKLDCFSACMLKKIGIMRPDGSIDVESAGIYRCKDLIDTAKTMGCRDVKLIDIGGGFPGERDFILDEFADMVNNALEDIDSSVEIISEPGRFIVASACNSAAYVIGKKTVMKENQKTFMYYITDGVYGSFNEELCTNNYFRSPVSSFRNRLIQSTSTDDEKYPSSVWGPTCDSFDVVLKNSMLPEFNVGDWLVWADIGAYSTSCANEFNGLQIPKVHPIMRRKDWLDFLLNYLSTEVKNGQNNEIY